MGCGGSTENEKKSPRETGGKDQQGQQGGSGSKYKEDPKNGDSKEKPPPPDSCPIGNAVSVGGGVKMGTLCGGGRNEGRSHAGPVRGVGFIKKGRQVVSCGADAKRPRSLSVAVGGGGVEFIGDCHSENIVALSCQDDQVATLDAAGGMALWEAAAGADRYVVRTEIESTSFPADDCPAVKNIYLSPDASLIAVCLEQAEIDTDLAVQAGLEREAVDGKVKVGWVTLHDAGNGELHLPFIEHVQEVSALSFSPCSKLACSGDTEGQVIVWCPDTGEVQKRADPRHNDPVMAATFGVDSTTQYTAERSQLYAWGTSMWGSQQIQWKKNKDELRLDLGIGCLGVSGQRLLVGHYLSNMLSILACTDGALLQNVGTPNPPTCIISCHHHPDLITFGDKCGGVHAAVLPKYDPTAGAPPAQQQQPVRAWGSPTSGPVGDKPKPGVGFDIGNAVNIGSGVRLGTIGGGKADGEEKERKVQCLGFIEDGAQLVRCRDAAKKPRSVHVSTGALAAEFVGDVHPAPIKAMATCPQRSDVATLCGNGLLQLWERGGGDKDVLVCRKQIDQFDFPGDATPAPRAVYMTPDGSLIAVTFDAALLGEDAAAAAGIEDASPKVGLVSIHDSVTGEISCPFIEHRWGVNVMSFSPDSMQAASADDSGKVILWSPDSGEVAHRLQPAHTDTAFICAYGGGGAGANSFLGGPRLLTGDLRLLRMWDTVKAKMVFEVTCAECGCTRGFLAGEMPGMRVVVVAREMPLVSVLDAHDGAQLLRFTPPAILTGIAVVPGCDVVGLGDITGELHCAMLPRYIATHVEMGPVGQRAKGAIRSLGFIDGGKQILAATTSARKPISNYTDKTCEDDTTPYDGDGHGSAMSVLACSPEDGHVVSMCEDGNIIAWERAGGAVDRFVQRTTIPCDAVEYPGGEIPPPVSIYLTPDASLIAIALTESQIPNPDPEGAGGDEVSCGYIAVYDSGSGSLHLPFVEHRATVTAMGFSADSNAAVSGDAGGSIIMWNPDSGEVRSRLDPPHKGSVVACAYCDGSAKLKGKHIVTADGGTLRIWDAEKATLLHERRAHEVGCDAEIAFAVPVGPRIACASQNATQITLIEAGSGRKVLTFANPGLVTSIAASPCGNMLGIGDSKGNIQLARLPKN